MQRVLASVVFFSASLAFADAPSFLFPEVPVAEPGVVSTRIEAGTDLAASGQHFVVVNVTRRLGSTFYASLIDSTGAPLRPASHVFHGAGDPPRVAGGDGGFLLAWGSLGSTDAVLLNLDGDVVRTIRIHDETRFPTSSGDSFGERPVAWNGSEYVVLTRLEESRGGPFRFIATRVSESGEIVQTDIDLGGGGEADMAARNGVSVAVINTGAGLTVRTLTGSGAVSEPLILPGTTGIFSAPRIAAGDDGYLIARRETTGVRIQHLDPQGVPDSSPTILAAPDLTGVHDVAWTGAGYAVAWTTSSNPPATSVTIARVAGMTEIDRVVIPDAFSPAIAWNGSTGLVAWFSRSPGINTVVARPLNGSEAHQVHRRPRGQSKADAAFLGGQPHVAWTEEDVSFVRSLTHRSTAGPFLGTAQLPSSLDVPIITRLEGNAFFAMYADQDVSFSVPGPHAGRSGSSIVFVGMTPRNADGVTLIAQRFNRQG